MLNESRTTNSRATRFDESLWWGKGADEELAPIANPPAAATSLTSSERKALAITSTFETGEPFGFGGLTGDFDGQGISFGLLQWNFGSGSLMPLLVEFANEAPDRFAQVFGPNAASFRELIALRGAQAVSRQLAFAKSIDHLVGKKHRVIEPWNTYFGRLAADLVFQKIEIRHAKKALDRAAEWCRKLGLTSERSLAFMLDTVAAHGPWWLNAPKFKGARIEALNARLALKRMTAGGRDLRDIEKLEVIGNLLADFARERFRDDVRVRKMWFVKGTGKIHGTNYDLARDFGVTDAPFTTSASPVPAPKTPTDKGQAPAPAATKSALVEDTIVTPVLLVRLIGGERDANKLATEAYYTLHPERGRRPIAKNETAEAAQWRRLRDGVVARLLQNWKNVPGLPSSPAAPASSSATNQELAPGAAPVSRAQVVGSGTSLYVPIELGSERPASPLTGIYLPTGFRAGAEVDIILYLHGHKTENHYKNGPTMQIDGYWATSTKPQVPLREAVESSGKNVVLVAPTLGPKAQPGTLTQPGGLDAYLKKVLAALQSSAAFQGRAPALRRLILAAHSGSGVTMRVLASGRDAALSRLVECWGFDCFYSPKGDRNGWLDWAKKNPKKTLFAHYATDVCCTKVKPGERCPGFCGPTTIARGIATSARAGRLKNVVMLQAKGGHFDTVRGHFGQRVSEASFLEGR